MTSAPPHAKSRRSVAEYHTLRIFGKWAKSLGLRPGRIERVVVPVLVFCWPPAYLWFYSTPSGNQYLAIGNDFIVLYYQYKLYLIDQMTHFRVPLWSPSESAGYPFFSSPFAQVLYPLNTFLALYYWITGGYTALDHQRFTVLGISILALGLFLWLRSLDLPLRSALFATLIMSISFKVTEILRFPNAIHTAAWYPWVLFAFTRIVRSTKPHERFKYGLLLALASICLLTGGYPYYIYYSVFLFGPYFLLFAIPALRTRILQLGAINWRQATLSLIGAAIAPVVVCAPYLYHTSILLQQTTDRDGSNFDYSTEINFEFKDTIGSLVFPPSAQVEGWYYFGTLGVLLILVFLFTGSQSPYVRPAVHDGSRQEHTSAYSARWTMLFIMAWLGTITYITYGRDSQLFVFLWHNLPFFSSLRSWGRLNIVLVPILAWLLALAYASMERLITDVTPARARRCRSLALVVIVLSGALIVAVQGYLSEHQLFDQYWTLWFVGSDLPMLVKSSWLASTNIGATEVAQAFEAAFRTSAIASTGTLLFLVALSRRRSFHTARTLGLVLTALVLLATIEIGPVGPLMWTRGFQPVEDHRRLDVEALDEASFSVRRIEQAYATISLQPAFNVSTVPNWYLQRYVMFRALGAAEPAPMHRLLGMTDGRRLYCTEGIKQMSIQAFLDDADTSVLCQVSKSAYNGDTLVVLVDADVDRYVSFIDNWYAGWQATVDGDQAPIELLFGTFKSVRVPRGRHTVEFAYKPNVYAF